MIQQVAPKTVTKRENRSSSLLDYVAPLASVAGSVVSQNPVLIGAAAVGAAQQYSQMTAPRQKYSVTEAKNNLVNTAMQRRTQYLQEDPLQSLKEAQNALASTQMDAETRSKLEMPILKAMQGSV